ncbi:serine hydrolase [Robiginitalea sp. SC105]|uniref:serine hydrolase n=1 Tax=Robiginitalea sp. SC105 TaxID=2762332 RepID=UPI00163AC17C|nr:serine hydrolase [Robiginitalea sp. SC105]MBC2838552.1 serine hydrolase [Robiginitalea sp. SC105]
MKQPSILATFGLLLLLCTTAGFYPIDGYERTGIQRLLRLERTLEQEGAAKLGLPAGAMRSWKDISLTLSGRAGDSTAAFMAPTPEFQKKFDNLFRGLERSYSIAILDISDPNNPRYAARNETAGYQPGSVGKIAVLHALFQQLAAIYPDDFTKRTDLLRSKSVRAGAWGLTDEHTIPVYNPEKNTLIKRQVIASDVFTLYEWTDHMMSVSNNGAASIVWREALLMAAFGERYPELTEAEAEAWFKETPRTSITDLAIAVVNEPLRALGIGQDAWRLGSFFTRGANNFVGDKGGSIGTPAGLMQFLIQLEQGRVIDTESSLEMKRLMYMTDRRIRYAQSPALKEAAVYFKSGSLYKCDRVKNPDCGKYMGNVFNYMNSVAIVEHPDNCRYIVVLMSNVLGKNSASDHLYLASAIDRIVREQ